jgi:hypothetical protein
MPAGADIANADAPVVVELFTSEGCSSCPPADELMSKLMQSKLFTGKSVLFIGEHVDYWNYLGWTDPFSSPRFSARQYEYAKKLRQRSSYTPEMIVDGSAGFLGSDENTAIRMISAAALEPKARLSTERGTSSESTQLVLNIKDIPAHYSNRKAHLLVAVLKDNVVSNIRSGENGGRRLVHDAVAMDLSIAATVEPTSAQLLNVPIKIPSNSKWDKGRVRVIIFLQDIETLRIWGATSMSLP